MTEAMVEQIRQRLQQAFEPHELDVLDEGHKHVGHIGEGNGHFHIRIVSVAFTGKSPIMRHRMIYSAMEGLMNHGIHALSIDANAI